MTNYPEILSGLIHGKHRWLVTGSAGFTDSHITEALSSTGQDVIGLDDLSRGHRENINAPFIEGSITDINTCREAVKGCDYVLHHAALASVPESLADPVQYNKVNVLGFMNVLKA